MLTCKSPRKVLLVAYAVARRVLPRYSCKFSRQDFTWPHLFACLVLREHQGQSYRGIEALLRDVHWCRQMGLRKVPDHNTLCRAFHAIMSNDTAQGLLDRLARMLDACRSVGLSLGIDSTYFDTHHQSRHYEHRCRKNAERDGLSKQQRQAARVRTIPKLTLGADVATHLILSAFAQIGMRGDHREFEPLLRQACERAPVTSVLADAGFDSHDNHVTAREHLGVNSLIKAQNGAPGVALSPYRRQMQLELAGSQAGKPYARRAQVETVHSMLKRNLGDSLRARSAEARSLELLLRVLTHNIMIPSIRRVETEPVGTTFSWCS